MRTVPEPDLMQIAARGLARVVIGLLRDGPGVTGSGVVLLVGSGNNGGDALWAGAFLARRGAAVTALTLSRTVHEDGAAALVAAGGRVQAAAAADAEQLVAGADVVIDGIVGIGASGPLRPEAARLVTAVGDAAVVAADVPSGIDPNTGAVADPDAAVRADVTVTFGCLKAGLLLPPGRESAGVVELVDIGLGPALASTEPVVRALTLPDAAPFFAGPHSTDYKYSHGVVGVCAGSAEYPGAPHMVVGAARHAGVGMVRLWQGSAPEVAADVVRRYPDVVRTSGDPAQDGKATAWIVGPGIGTADEQREIVAAVLRADHPVVVDADALTLLAHHESLRRMMAGRSRPTVITPHVGEFARLGMELSDDRLASARRAAQALNVIVLLKGAGTVVAGPDGEAYVDQMGTAALATAGTGDALSGLIGAALARTTDDPARAVAAAVAVHGLAGRLASADDRPMTAWDLVEAVPDAVAAVRRA